MHLSTIPYALFAGNNLVHNADRIMALRSMGTPKDWLLADSGGCTRLHITNLAAG